MKKEKKDYAALAAQFRGTRTLIVDDNETALKMLEEMTRSFGFDVATATYADQALEILEGAAWDKQFSLVLMDWKMPGMNGIEAARRIKANPGLKGVAAVVMVTAYGREDIMRQAEAAGIEGFLIKPVNQSTLFDMIMETLGHGRAVPGTIQQGEKTVLPDNFDAIRGSRILLVEDNEINQQVAKELLQDEGFFVSVAQDGRQAVEAVLSSGEVAYDIVLMDLQMPVMDGYAATRELRRDNRFDGLPIIAMTADAMSGVREKVLDIGMNDYVSKPIDPASLFNILAKWIKPGTRRLRASNASQSSQAQDRDVVLPDIPGIDVHAGLLRIGGNKRRYKALLAKFIENQGDAGNRIKKALEAGAKDEAVRLAHTLKGVSGSIGALKLYEQAIDVEAELKAGDNPGLSEKINDMAETLVRTCQALQSALEPQETWLTEGRTELDRAAIAPHMKALSQLLSDSSTKARYALEEILPMVKGTPMEKAFTAIAGYVSAYAFDEALAELKNTARDFDMPLGG